MGCAYCDQVETAYNRTRTEPHLFTLHLDVGQIQGSVKKNPNKKSKLKEFEKKASALRNTKGGDILIHLENQDKSDLYLGHLDDSIDGSLKNLIPDGCLYTDVYTRRWLADDDGFESFRNVIVLTIEQSNFVTTVDFKTKIPSDFKIESPSTLNIVSLLKRVSTSSVNGKPQLLDIGGNLHESRRVELKYLPPESYTAESFVEEVWFQLRFREHLCSMSKLPSGGSYFVGIQEQKRKKKKYETIDIIHAGFPKPWSDEDFKECLNRKLKDEASLQTPEGDLAEVPQEILKYEFHELEKKNYILQIAIGFVNGIVFYNKQGPETYRIDDDQNIIRMKHSHWFKNIRSYSIKVAES